MSGPVPDHTCPYAVSLRYEVGVTAGRAYVMDEDTDITWVAAKITQFFSHESCGKCTPCREGTYWLDKVLDRIMDGRGQPSDVDLINSIAKNMAGNTLCALGDFAANPIIHTIKNFPEDFKAHLASNVPANKDERKPDNAAARAATGKGSVQGKRDLGVGLSNPIGFQVKVAMPVPERAVAGQLEREVAGARAAREPGQQAAVLGGAEIEREAVAKGPIEVGEAVATGAGRLHADYVIHGAVMGQDLRTDAGLVQRTTGRCLELADELECRSLALPAFGTGVGGFPLEECARLMVAEARGFEPARLERVVFAVFGTEAEDAFRSAVASG